MLLAMRRVANETYDGGRVVPIELEENLPPMPIVAAYKADHEPGALTLPFVDYCEQVFKEL